MNPTLLIRAAIAVVAVAVLGGGGFLAYRTFFVHAPKTAVAAKGPGATSKPSAKPSYTPIALPANAPKLGVDLDPGAIYPFAARLAQVNKLAHAMLVTNAEYHDNDAGQRYFTAVVTSCKALNARWPIARGVLYSKVIEPLHLRDDFTTFAFVEYFSQGQWGLSPCDGT